MNLQITAKMQKWLKVSPPPFSHKEDIYAWHLNYQIVNHKKFIILVHDLSKFTIVLWGIKKRDFLEEGFIYQVIMSAFLYQGYDLEMILAYLVAAPAKISFYKTAGHKQVGILNARMENALNNGYAIGLNFESFLQLHIGREINTWPVGYTNNEHYIIPADKMVEYLAS